MVAQVSGRVSSIPPVCIEDTASRIWQSLAFLARSLYAEESLSEPARELFSRELEVAASCYGVVVGTVSEDLLADSWPDPVVQLDGKGSFVIRPGLDAPKGQYLGVQRCRCGSCVSCEKCVQRFGRCSCSSSPVGDGCRSLCKPTGEGLAREERCQLVGACFCLISALQGQGSVGSSGGVRDGFDRYAQHRDLIGKVGAHLILGGQLSPVARKFLKRDLADLIGEVSLQSFDAFQRIFDGIEFIHDSSSPVSGCCGHCPPAGEGSTSSSDEGVE